MFSVIDVVIGFQVARYTVNAQATEVMVRVRVLSGGLSREVEVEFETSDDSAVGKTHI